MIFMMFRPAATREVAKGLYAVRSGFVNFYALKTSGGVLLVDTGMNASFAAVGLKKCGLAPSDVCAVFLTHSDYDHAGGLKAFPNAAVYLLKDEEPLITGAKARRGFMHNRRIPGCVFLSDGQAVSVGDATVEAIHTPGHTIGSASYRINGNILATGDLMRLPVSGKPLPFSVLMNMDHKKDIKSLDDMRGAIDDAEYVLTAHTGYIKHDKNAG